MTQKKITENILLVVTGTFKKKPYFNILPPKKGVSMPNAVYTNRINFLFPKDYRIDAIRHRKHCILRR